MSIRILQGDVMATLPQIPPGSCDVVCTSPPYWMLRSYLPKGHPLKPLELGSEPTPAAYVESMVRVFRLVREAMADHAVCWLNIGDTYSSSPRTATQRVRPELVSGDGRGKGCLAWGERDATEKGDTRGAAPEGSLCLIPQRLAIALSDDGWIVRSVVVWHKPAPMPASVAGWRWARCRVKVGNAPLIRNEFHQQRPSIENESTTDHHKIATWQDCPGCPKCEPHGGYVLRRGSWRPTSAWEPILMLAKGAGYFSDGEAVKQPSTNQQGQAAMFYRNTGSRQASDGRNSQSGHEAYPVERIDDGTANLRDVWTGPPLEDLSKEELLGLIRSWQDGELPDVFRIAAEPLKEKHYAAFPSELVLRCLRAGTSARGYCPACGMPWCRVVEASAATEAARAAARNGKDWTARGYDNTAKIGENKHGNDQPGFRPENKTLGWKQSCQCPEQEPRPGVVLDPFCGSGRTGLVARQLGLDFIGAELNPAYVEMAKRLLVEDSPLFNQVES